MIQDGEVIKWGGGFIAAVLAFFGLKKMVVAEIEAKLKLHIDLLHAEAKLVEEHNRQTLLDITRMEALIALKLDEDKHGLICLSMQKEMTAVKECITSSFNALNKRLDARRSGDDKTK